MAEVDEVEVLYYYDCYIVHISRVTGAFALNVMNTFELRHASRALEWPLLHANNAHHPSSLIPTFALGIIGHAMFRIPCRYTLPASPYFTLFHPQLPLQRLCRHYRRQNARSTTHQDMVVDMGSRFLTSSSGSDEVYSSSTDGLPQR